MRVKDIKVKRRSWDEISFYESICVVSSGEKHDSGWALMNIVGMEHDTPIEIAACCDDINWIIPIGCELRTDMYFNSSTIHFWADGYKFKVGASLSSTKIQLVKI